jgi:hypothetical protein
LHIDIAGAQAHFDPARLAFDCKAGCACHRGREGLRTAHAAEASRKNPFPGEAAAVMLAAHFHERLVGALNDALRPDIDP